MAKTAYTVRYALRHRDDTPLALTFILVGEDPDLILLDANERSGPRDVRASPGQVDQQVYRVQQIDEIKEAVRDKITRHLPSRH
jgi:hypothetical protein